MSGDDGGLHCRRLDSYARNPSTIHDQSVSVLFANIIRRLPILFCLDATNEMSFQSSLGQ